MNYILDTISKSKQALFAINLIRKFLTKSELLQVITSNYYSILYYNSEIWHIPTNTHRCKTQLMSASAAPLKLCNNYYDRSVSFIDLHKQNKRATPDKMMKYKHAIQLHKIYNCELQS